MRLIPEEDKDLLLISDGKLYDANDLVKVGCHDCMGCSECCRGMGDTILLDPYDCYRLMNRLDCDFQGLLNHAVEFHMEEGLILPNLKMLEDGNHCFFLNEEGRCQVHESRPGICRLFPLGRNYSDDKLEYFLLQSECPAKNRTKMKVSKWLDAGNTKEYERFLVTWHNLTKAIREQVLDADDEMREKISKGFLIAFYYKPYGEDFFTEFFERVSELGT